MADSFATRATFEVNGKTYTYASLPRLGERFDIARLPFSMKILLENLLRHEAGVTGQPRHIQAVANWDPAAEPETEVAFMPARVGLQDLAGLPCRADRAAQPRHVVAVANWDPAAEPETELAFMPARVVLQDFTGVPCVVDLAAMRDAVVKLGGRPEQINPQIPSELVIDHSVQVDAFG